MHSQSVTRNTRLNLVEDTTEAVQLCAFETGSFRFTHTPRTRVGTVPGEGVGVDTEVVPPGGASAAGLAVHLQAYTRGPQCPQVQGPAVRAGITLAPSSAEI